jgi:hypothetical protein
VVTLQRAFRARLAHRAKSPILVTVQAISLSDVRIPSGEIPSLFVAIAIDDGLGGRSDPCRTEVLRNESNPSWSDRHSCALPACKFTPTLHIDVYNWGFGGSDERVAHGQVRLTSTSGSLEYFVLRGVNGAADTTLFANFAVYRGLESVAFSQGVERQLGHRAELRKSGPTYAQLAQQDLEAGMVVVYGSSYSTMRTKRFCNALASRLSGNLIHLPTVISSDLKKGPGEHRILADDEREAVKRNEALPTQRLIKLIEAERERVTGPVVLCDFPKSNAELDQLEGRKRADDIERARATHVLCAMQLYEFGNKLCLAAARLGAEQRLTLLLADSNRSGKGGLSISAQLEQALRILREHGLQTENTPYPSKAEAKEIIASAAQKFLVRKAADHREKVHSKQQPKLRRWRESSLVRADGEELRSPSVRSASPTFKVTDDAPLSGRGMALQHLEGAVGPLTLRRMTAEARTLAEHVLTNASARRPIQRPRKACPPQEQAVASPRLNFFRPRARQYRLASTRVEAPGSASTQARLSSRPATALLPPMPRLDLVAPGMRISSNPGRGTSTSRASTPSSARTRSACGSGRASESPRPRQSTAVGLAFH